MNLRQARIGYDGYSRDFCRPGDRRRFCAFARHRGLTFERPDLKRDYDVVVVTHNGDLAGWTRRKERAPNAFKYVFELTEAYYVQRGLARRYLKGAGRYALGFDSWLSADFLATLERTLRAADAVVCTTEEQAAAIAAYNPNVFVTFDWFGDELGPPKDDYASGPRLKIAWEGQSVTLKNLLTIAPALEALGDAIELHVITDPTIPRYFHRYGAYPTERLLAPVRADIRLHPWDRATFSALVAQCDLAIIPIDPNDDFACSKPENKLVMLWQLGMPVLTSPTPAYLRTMTAAGDPSWLCSGVEEWTAKLREFIATPAEERRERVAPLSAFAREHYGLERFMAAFDRVFRSIGFD